jgi:hypothetical protein
MSDEKRPRSLRKVAATALVLGAAAGGYGVANAVSGSGTTTAPSTPGSQPSGFGSNEDPAHEATESKEREAQENAGGIGRFHGGPGHERAGGRGSNEDPAHEATESAEREAQEHAQGSAPSDPQAAPTPSATPGSY